MDNVIMLMEDATKTEMIIKKWGKQICWEIKYDLNSYMW